MLGRMEGGGKYKHGMEPVACTLKAQRRSNGKRVFGR